MWHRNKLLFLFIFGGYIIISLLVFRFGTAFSDEGLLYQWGQRILRGELPYTNFFLQMTPLTFYIQAALIKFFGMNILVGRIFKQIEGLLLGILTYLIVIRALKNKRAALIATIISFAWSGALHIRFHWYTMDAGLSILLGIYFFIRFIETGKAKMLAFVGLSIGSSILFKQNMGIAAFLVSLILCIIYGLRQKRKDIIKWVFILTSTAFIPIILFISYYIWAGGDIHKLYLQTIVYPQKFYGCRSSLEIFLYPLKVFLLIHKQDPIYYIGILIILLSSFLIFVKSNSKLSKIIGGLCIMTVILWSPASFVRFSVWTLNFILFLAAVMFSAYDAFKQRDSLLSFCRFSLSVFALVNIYAGLMGGAGLGRFVEIMTASFYIYGVIVDLMENSKPVKALWNKTIIWNQRQCIYAGTTLYAILGLTLLIQNASFIPGMDFPLYRLNKTMQIEGARGIIGEAKYVSETEATVRYVKNILALKNKKEIFVFPLNLMLYPLIGAKNPTIYDVLQTPLIGPVFLPDLMQQLKKNPPVIIVMQKRANPPTGPLREEKTWVYPQVVDVVSKFVVSNYEKLYETQLYYEVYGLK